MLSSEVDEDRPRSQAVIEVLDFIRATRIEHPVTVKSVADVHRVSNQAANNAVTGLVDSGVLDEVTGRNYNRVFLFRPTRTT